MTMRKGERWWLLSLMMVMEKIIVDWWWWFCLVVVLNEVHCAIAVTFSFSFVVVASVLLCEKFCFAFSKSPTTKIAELQVQVPGGNHRKTNAVKTVQKQKKDGKFPLRFCVLL